MDKAKKKYDETMDLMRSMGFLPPKLQPISPDEKYLNVEGIEVPPIIAEFLSRFDSHVLSVLEPGVLLWQCDMDGLKLLKKGIRFMDLEEMYFDAIRQAGGAFINFGRQYDLMFPRRTHLMRTYFDKVGFGIDDFLDPQTGQPLIENINSPERVKQRLDDALAIFDAMMNECPVTLRGITATHAYLKTTTPPADKKWANEWAQKIWDYYVKHKSSAMYKPREDPMDWYSRKQCFKEAEIGLFDLGGFP